MVIMKAPKIRQRLPFNHPQWSVGETNNWAIYKVPYRLREVNKEAYEPNVVSIGPYHHPYCNRMQHLRVMEEIKRSCFDKIVVETKLDFSKFLNALEPLEERIHTCYGKGIYFGEDLGMMVYDGCFIVMLIRKIISEEDLCKLRRSIQTDIWYDLLLLENQIPFFVLFKFYSMIVPNGGDLDGFTRSALSFFQIQVQQGPAIGYESENHTSRKKDIKHLLDLVHSCCSPSPQGIKQHQDFKAKTAAKAKEPNSLRSWKFIPSATELQETGIKFLGEKLQDRDQDQGPASLFDIIFTEDTKVLKIPTLQVDDNTERFLRNFMAYEQFIPSREPSYVSDYLMFMVNLINTGKDVQLLCNSGIINNWLGDAEAVAQMFNKLWNFVCLQDDFYYAETCQRLNNHFQRKWKK